MSEETDGVGSASYAYNEHEFIAAYRGIRMAQNPAYDSFVVRLGIAIVGHVMLVSGILVSILWLAGAEGKNGPIPWGAALFNLGVAAVSGLVLHARIYGYRTSLKGQYRTFPLRDEKVQLEFGPARFAFRHALASGSVDWSLIEKVTELRDGFVIRSAASGEIWVPRHAFEGPFQDVEVGDFLKARVGRFRVVDRLANLPEKPSRSGPASTGD